MKKHIIIVFTLIISAIFILTIHMTDKPSISDLTLANIEAIAEGEGGLDENGNPIPRTCFLQIKYEWLDKNEEVLYCEPVGDGTHICKEKKAGWVSKIATCNY